MSLDLNPQIELTSDQVEINLCILREYLDRLLKDWWDSEKGSEVEEDYSKMIYQTMGLVNTFVEQGGRAEHWTLAKENCKLREFPETNW